VRPGPGLGSVVIAAEPPVCLFTHSVKSLNEWLRYSNENLPPGGAPPAKIAADRNLAALLKCEPGQALVS